MQRCTHAATCFERSSKMRMKNKMKGGTERGLNLGNKVKTWQIIHLKGCQPLNDDYLSPNDYMPLKCNTTKYWFESRNATSRYLIIEGQFSVIKSNIFDVSNSNSFDETIIIIVCTYETLENWKEIVSVCVCQYSLVLQCISHLRSANKK